MGNRVWVAVILILATAGYTRFLSDVHAVSLKAPLEDVPLAIGEWRGRSDEMDERVIGIVGVEDYLLRDYVSAGGLPVYVYVGYYEKQREGDQIHSPRHCLPGAGWRPIRSDVVAFATPGFNGGETRANRYVIAKGEDRQLVLYWYQSGQRNITSEYAAKLWLVIDSIVRKRSDGALVRLIVSLPRDMPLESAQARLEGFARDFLPELGKVLPD